MDIYENKDQIVLEAELPGMNRDDFDLSVENNVITLRGERHFEKKDETDNYHRVERAYGSFTRSFTLPNTVSADGATAEYSNGVLRVTLPKREETKARRIEIKTDGTQAAENDRGKSRCIESRLSEGVTSRAEVSNAGATGYAASRPFCFCCELECNSLTAQN